MILSRQFDSSPFTSLLGTRGHAQARVGRARELRADSHRTRAVATVGRLTRSRFSAQARRMTRRCFALSSHQTRQGGVQKHGSLVGLPHRTHAIRLGAAHGRDGELADRGSIDERFDRGKSQRRESVEVTTVLAGGGEDDDVAHADNRRDALPSICSSPTKTNVTTRLL